MTVAVGPDFCAFETLPQDYGQFLAYRLHRREIVVRENVIVAILGLNTLGYDVGATISRRCFDRAILLVLATTSLAVAVVALSRMPPHARSIATLRTRLSDGGLIGSRRVAN